jgi:hypothetical protein
VEIRLTRKFAEALNRLDLRAFRVGEVIELEDAFAYLLLREGWAELPITRFGADDYRSVPGETES